MKGNRKFLNLITLMLIFIYNGTFMCFLIIHVFKYEPLDWFLNNFQIIGLSTIVLYISGFLGLISYYDIDQSEISDKLINKHTSIWSSVPFIFSIQILLSFCYLPNGINEAPGITLGQGQIKLILLAPTICFITNRFFRRFINIERILIEQNIEMQLNRNDPDFMYRAIQQDITAIVSISDELKSNSEFMLKLIKHNGAFCFIHAASDLQSNSEFVAKALKIDEKIKKYINI
jgi:hypothetical protein